MAEVMAEVKVMAVHMKCDECGEGLMESVDNLAYAGNPPQYRHKCNKCGHEAYYPQRYPYQRFMLKEPFREEAAGEMGQ